MIVGVDRLEQYSPIMFDFKKLYLKLKAATEEKDQMVLPGIVKEAEIKLVKGKALNYQ